MYRSLVYALAMAAIASAAVGKDENIAFSPNPLRDDVGDVLELRNAQQAADSSTPVRTGVMVTSSSSGSAGPLMSSTMMDTSEPSTSVRTGVMATNSVSGSGGSLMSATTNVNKTAGRTGVQLTTSSSVAIGTGSTLTPATTTKSNAVRGSDMSVITALGVLVGGLVMLMA